MSGWHAVSARRRTNTPTAMTMNGMTNDMPGPTPWARRALVRRVVSSQTPAATDAAPEWRALSLDDRAAVLLRAADLLAGPWRARLNAATMLGYVVLRLGTGQVDHQHVTEIIDWIKSGMLA